MTAIWGSLGTTDGWNVEELGRCLRHRGTHESSWAPAPHVRFAWRRDEGASASVIPQVPLMFTGSITNRSELAQRLGRDSKDVACDAGLLWELYCTHGSRAFGLVNGQFAIALYDARTDELVLAADRWAVQPLYAASIESCWVFATEYRALLALPQLQARIDAHSVAFLNATKYLPARRTLLQDVHAVAPGECLRLSRNKCEPQPYAPLKLDIPENSSEPALAAGLRDALLAAARRTVAGYDRIGIALSAGLDSTLTLGFVRAMAPGARIHTYTASFDPHDPDLALAAEAARHFGTIHREIILGPQDVPRLLGELVCAMEDPCAREEMLVYHVLAQEAASEVPVLLYGHMADVLFGGMPRHLLVKLAAGLPFARNPLTAFYDYTQTGAVPRSVLGRLLVAAYYRGRQVPPPRVMNEDYPAADARLHLARVEPLNAVLLDAIRHPTEVAAMERLHARAGVRFGSLFHDAGVAQWAFRIPDRLKIRGRCRKYILRRAAADILPPAFTSRPKGMIRITQDRRLWRVVQTMAADLLAPGAVAARGLFHPQDVARLLGNRRNTEEQFYRIWTLLLLELWCRTFIDSRSASCQPQTALSCA